MKVASHATIVAYGSSQCTGLPVLDPDLVVRAICDQHILPVCVMRKCEIVNASAHSKLASAFGASRWRRRMHKEAGHEFARFGEYLNPVAAAFADVNEAIGRDVNAMERGRELLLIRRRA